jgi:hypothetical protein
MNRFSLALLAACLAVPSASFAATADAPDANGCWPANDGSDVQCCSDMPEPRPDACAAGGTRIGETGPVVGGIGAGQFQPRPLRPLSANPSGGGGGGGGGNHKAAAAADVPESSAGAATGDYAALMSRPPYVGSKEMPCRYGPPMGQCTQYGKPLPPPPSPDGFHVVPIGIQPFYGQTNHTIYPLSGTKWALKFVARPFGPFPVHFDSPNGFMARSALEMFVAISEKPGDFDVSEKCLVTPDFLSNGWAGGAPHSVAQIDVVIGAPMERRCALVPGRTYYLNFAGDCSDHYGDVEGVAKSRQNGCPTDLVEVNGWIRALTPGGPAEFCAAKLGKGVGPDGFNCQ